MNNQSPIPNYPSSAADSPAPHPTPSSGVPAYRDWREERRAQHRARHHGGKAYGWIGGTILIMLGVIFQLQNLGLLLWTNWWALFIFLPAFGSFASAWANYREHDGAGRGWIGSLTIGCLLTVLGLAFLFNLDLSRFWPALLVVGGLALLLQAFLPPGPDSSQADPGPDGNPNS